MNDHRPRRLTRSRDSKIAGVAGGIAEYFDIDPTIVRVLFVVAALLGLGFGAVIAYVVLWVVMPEEVGDTGEDAPVGMARETQRGAEDADAAGRGANPALVVGVLLVGVGIILLGSEIGLVRWFGFGLARISWPVLLILAGGALLLLARDRDRNRAGRG